MKKILLSPLVLTYDRLLATRETLYQRNVFKSYQSKSRVISIGNLTMGGTGKTPMTLLLIDYYLKKNLKVAVVSRNYKSQFKGTEKVQLAHPHGASYYGDEAFMLQTNFPDVPIYVGPKKSETVKMVDQHESVDIILVDDGFQHWALKRDIDVVLLDATETEKNYNLVPLGRGRETFTSLMRAQIIVITKANLATSEKINWLYQQIPDSKKSSTFFFDSFLGDPQIVFSPSGAAASSTDDLGKKPMVAFCGLAKPDLFFKMLQGQRSSKLVSEISFSDHHAYTQPEIEQMISAHRNVKHFMTTEKDYKKVLAVWPKNVFLWMTPLIFKFSTRPLNSGTENEFFAKLNH